MATPSKGVGRGVGGGRPPAEFEYDKIMDLALIQCTVEEIAHIMHYCVATCYNTPKFLEVYKEGTEKGKSSLRRMQYKAALNGNATMLVWLGKNVLHQRDNIDSNITAKVESQLKGLTTEQLLRLAGEDDTES